MPVIKKNSDQYVSITLNCCRANSVLRLPKIYAPQRGFQVRSCRVCKRFVVLLRDAAGQWLSLTSMPFRHWAAELAVYAVGLLRRHPTHVDWFVRWAELAGKGSWPNPGEALRSLNRWIHTCQAAKRRRA